MVRERRESPLAPPLRMVIIIKIDVSTFMTPPQSAPSPQEGAVEAVVEVVAAQH